MKYHFFVFVILSFSIVGEAQQCPENHYWVSAHPRDKYVKADGVPYSAANVVGHCRSRSKAYDFWINRFKNGKIEGWPHKKEKTKDWTAKEIEALIKAFEKVPKFLWTDVSLQRADASVANGNPSTSSEGFIVLYDIAFRSQILTRILVHELAHRMYAKMTPFQKTSYSIVSGWGESGSKGEYKSTQPRSFVAHDGNRGPDEDFANNMEYLIVEPVRLKMKSPEIFDWMNVEYGDKIKERGVN